jgi:hypothetical protein
MTGVTRKKTQTLTRLLYIVVTSTVYDFRLQRLLMSELEKKNFKNYFNEKLIKLTGPIWFLLDRGNRTSAKVADCYIFFVFSSPGHRPCELLSWVSVRRPSVSFSHLNLPLWNRWTDFNQTCHRCSLDGPLPDLCFWCRLEIQHGC